jgi:hypothetical protein
MSDENIMTDITLADVNLMLQIIEICAKRGAFNPDEFVTVGSLTDKLKQVMKSAKEEVVAPTPTEEEPTND